MSSSIVIKVKFGETLRRFNASINDKKLDLDTVLLREKIRGMFGFDSGVEFSMTYVDEDGDLVTLADDDDLHDVVRQSLNPLRITVILNETKPAAGSNGNSTPMRSSQKQFPLSALNTGVSDMLKSVQEPLREVLANLPLDLASKATGASPAVADLLEKMTAVYMDQILGNSKVNPPASGSSNVNSESSTVKDDKVPVNSEAGSSNLKKKDKQVQNETEGVKFKEVQPPPKGVDLNVPYFQYEPLLKKEGSAVENASGYEKKKDVSSGSKPAGFAIPTVDSLRQHLKDRMASQKQELDARKKQVDTQTDTEFKDATNDFGRYSGWVQGMLNATNQCPFGGMPLPTESESHGRHHHRHSRSPHWRRYSVDNNGLGTVFHRGVRCDGCGVHPITGPRYKSKVKVDYDLCSVCFAGTEDATDYMKIDRPTNGFRHHPSFKGLPDLSYRIPPPILPHAFRAPGSKLPRSKLDSRFILDVNILDGTIMAPFTEFTKIWRMRNNGSIIWPHGSQLHWIGGDRLSNSLSVDVEIPVDGLPVDQELDIAVDFIAPELPGRYVSYWRMASPSGQKYGQRVWVLIQVDTSMKDLGETSINLNLPPVVNYPEVANEDHPSVDRILPGNNIIKVTSSENPPAATDSRVNDQEMKFPINDSLIIGSPVATVSPPTAPAISSVFNTTEVENALASLPAGPVSSSGFYPTVELDSASYEPINYTVDPINYTADFSGVVPIIGGSGPSSPIVASSSAAPDVNADQEQALVNPTVASASATQEVNADKEEALVKDLESMGFKQLDLNKEVLRMNNYDLEKSIDDLCGVSDWDPMLEELQQMGFQDNEANRRLLKKNNGSIKRVVMDLIYGEKA